VDELLKIVAAGGDVGTLAILFVYVRHSGMLAELRVRIGYIERALGVR